MWVETSIGCRGGAAAGLAASGVDHDARQDEDQADDPEQVSGVLRQEGVMRCVAGRSEEVDGDVHQPGDDYHHKADSAGGRHGPQLHDHPVHCSFYRQHVLVIHLRHERCQVFQ
jgi:hypothetical protein